MTTSPVIQAVQKMFYKLWFPPQVVRYRLMGCCTVQDMIDRFGEEELIKLTDKDNLADINTDKLEQAIAEASSEMDPYLIRYLPLSAAHPSLTRVACHITHYRLYGDSVINRVNKLYGDSIQFLKCISKGDISLGPNTYG